MGDALIRNWSRIWLFGAIAMSILCLTVTFFSPELREYDIYYIAKRFKLGGENDIGPWWSGVLLILASIHAFDGFFAHRERRTTTANGWAVISLILFLLSIDEISSIHERIDRVLQFGTWLSLLPFAIILIMALAYGAYGLWQDPEQRGRAVGIVISFILLSSVGLQEYLQHNSQWWGNFASIRLVLEEGTEMLAMLILLKMSMSNTNGIFQPEGATGRPVFQVLASLKTPLLIIGAVSVPIFAYVTSTLPDQHRGHPSDWLGATAFLFAGLVVSREFFKYGKNIGWGSWLLSIICWIMSAAAVAITPVRNPQNKFLLLYVLTLIICLVWFAHAKHNKVSRLIPIVTIVVMSALFLTDITLFLIYLLYPAIGLLAFYLNGLIDAASRCENADASSRKLKAVTP